MTYQEEVLEWALTYAARGWHVFPLHSVNDDGSCTCGDAACDDIGKHPYADYAPRGLKDGTCDPEKIKGWFGNGKLLNVGIVTGEISNLTVLDIDCGPGKGGGETWVELTQEHGAPYTLIANTGGGGYHYLTLFNSALKNATNVLGKGVDCRNKGGYIVGVPSRHRSGKQYAWDDWTRPLAHLPEHLSKKKENRGRPRKDDPTRQHYGLREVRRMLMDYVPAEDRDLWRNVGVILGREFHRSEEAWQLYVEWADKWQGQKGRGHDDIMHQAFHTISQESAEKELTIATIVAAAQKHGWSPKTGDVLIEDLLYIVPSNDYLDKVSGNHWTKEAVDAVVSPKNEDGKILKASEYLKKYAKVTTIIRDPTLTEDYIKDVDYVEGELKPWPGRACYNTYKRATIPLGDAALALPFEAHVHRLMPREGDAEQFLNYMAHRVQCPGVKPRFALLLSGGQGTGKDTAVEMCCPAIGDWNVESVDPAVFDSAYNEYLQGALVRINEAANLHDMSKWAFNERTKVMIAGCPDIARINPKYGEQYSMKMYCGVIVTTNNLLTGIYVPPDDRRYDIIACASLAEMGLADEAERRRYFEDLWTWFRNGGNRHVAAFLHARDLSNFSASNGQRKTAAHRELVAVNQRTDDWLDEILEGMGYPDYVRADMLIGQAVNAGEKDAEVRRKLPGVLDRLGYARKFNPDHKRGKWTKDRHAYIVYMKKGTQADFEKWWV